MEESLSAVNMLLLSAFLESRMADFNGLSGSNIPCVAKCYHVNDVTTKYSIITIRFPRVRLQDFFEYYVGKGCVEEF